ncbi:hypothetical protein FLCH110379_17460 [Flavobacterium chungbukense]
MAISFSSFYLNNNLLNEFLGIKTNILIFFLVNEFKLEIS